MQRRIQPPVTTLFPAIGRIAVWLGCVLLLAGCAGGMSRSGGMQLAGCPVNGSRVADPAEGSTRSAEEQIIVDCELPGIQFEIGDGIFYTSPPRPARTSVWQCRVGGGKQMVFDAANLQKVENVWKGCAEAGDKIAQTYLGEFYERAADYANAAVWYRKAAEQGYSRAQANLGFLLAKGLGVAQDSSASQEWYRKASGLPAQAPAANESALVSQLRADLAQANRLLDKAKAGLKQQMAEKEALSMQIKQPPAQPDPAERQRNRQLQQRIVELEQKAQADQTRIATLQTQIAQTETQLRGQGVATETLPAPAVGRYFALVIGINDYTSMNQLQTPVNDAKAVADLLRGKFGFTSVTLLLNQEATRVQIWKALIGLRQQLSENDNLLIYFAGHGQKEDREGFWLPVDADKPPHKYTWISDRDIAYNTAWKDMPARHVLIVADSCFSGTLRSTDAMSAPRPTVVAGGRPDSIDALKASLISRKFLTSGGDEPVLDKGRSNHSVFAAAFIDFLKNYNKPEPLSADTIYGQIEAAVYDQSFRLGHPQRPLYGPIQNAGDTDGEFYFRPSLRTAENRAVAGSGRF